MDLDIILYAIIAVVLFARLWSVFGRRNDEDTQRPNPFAAPPTPPANAQDASFAGADPAVSPNGALLPKPLLAAPASLAGGLEQIKILDPSFDEKQFLQGARTAFTMIVEDFAKSDLSQIERLLGPEVLPHFRQAIEARRDAGQVMESKILRIREADTFAAQVDDSRAIVTVRFISEQENVLRDAEGHVIGGNPDQVEIITDIWSFARDVKSSDPNWILIETKS